MNKQDRFFTYFSTIERELDKDILRLEKEGKKDSIPMIGKGMQHFLITLMELIAPKRILELGTAYGFSAILMAKYNNHLEELITIENYNKRIPVAKKNISEMGYDDIIHLYEGDACEIIKSLEGEFDFVLMDSAKGQYDTVWPYVRNLVKPGGVVITDDIMQDDTILESSFAVRRRNRTIHKRMRSFLKNQLRDEAFTGSVFTIDDGISFLVKKGDDE